MEYLRLVGVLVVLAGFALRLRVTVVVVAAGLVTGLAARMPLVGTDLSPGIVDSLGRAFANNRIITLFVLALPAIGLSERYGLQERARELIQKVPAATVGRLQFVYQLFRVVVVALGIRLGSGHVAFSRPLVVPMSLGAVGLDERSDLHPEVKDRVKAGAGASENYGNFFGQNLFFGAAGVALTVSTLNDHGLVVDPRLVSLWSMPIAIASLLVGFVQYSLFDRWIERHARDVRDNRDRDDRRDRGDR
jgi:uncharacterized membrane protein